MGEVARTAAAARLVAAAWLARSTGDTARAVALAARAVDSEVLGAELPWVLALEQEGDLLLDLGRAADAARVYAKSLSLMPHRARSLFGDARAAELTGDLATARALSGVCGSDGRGWARPELAAARRFVTAAR